MATCTQQPLVTKGSPPSYQGAFQVMWSPTKREKKITIPVHGPHCGAAQCGRGVAVLCEMARGITGAGFEADVASVGEMRIY